MEDLEASQLNLVPLLSWKMELSIGKRLTCLVRPLYSKTHSLWAS